MTLSATLSTTGAAFAQSNNVLVVAYSPTSGRYGWALGYDAVEAQEAAGAYCADPTCLSLFATNGCGALATAPDHSFGWAQNQFPEYADQQAMDNCSSYAPGCTLAVSMCVHY
jgi:hypothetical protein